MKYVGNIFLSDITLEWCTYRSSTFQTLTVMLFRKNFKIAGGHEGGDVQFAYNISPISNGSRPTFIVGGFSGSSKKK